MDRNSGWLRDGAFGEVIARHPRSYDHEDMIFDPVHHLPLIERKINALDQAAPLADWDLPDEFHRAATIGAAGSRRK